MQDYIEQLASFYSLKKEKTYAYGDIEGYMYTLCPQKNNTTIINISLARPLDESQQESVNTHITNMAHSIGLIPSQSSVVSKNIRTVFNIRLTKNIHLFDTFVTATTTTLNELGAISSGFCSLCQGHKDEPIMHMEVKRSIDCTVVSVHQSCQQTIQSSLDSAYDKTHGKSNVITGVLTGLIGGLICSIPWILIYMIGFVISLAGLLIGFGVNAGYQLGKGPDNKSRIYITVLLVIVCVIVAQFTCQVIDLKTYLDERGLVYDLVSLPRATFLIMAENSDYAFGFIKGTLLGLLFAGMGILSLINRLSQGTSKARVRTRTIS